MPIIQFHYHDFGNRQIYLQGLSKAVRFSKNLEMDVEMELKQIRADLLCVVTRLYQHRCESFHVLHHML